MTARGVDVLEVLTVAIVADRAEAFVHHDFGKADDGIERRADLMADLREKVGFCRGRPLCLALAIEQVLLRALPLGDVAQPRAEFAGAFGNSAHGHEQRDQPALTYAADHLAAVVEHAGHAVERKPVEVIERGAATLRREQLAERLADELAALVTEQRLGAAAER